MHEAAEKGFIDIVQLLLDKGAVPEHWVDSSGDSLFASQRHPKILHPLYQPVTANWGRSFVMNLAGCGEILALWTSPLAGRAALRESESKMSSR